MQADDGTGRRLRGIGAERIRQGGTCPGSVMGGYAKSSNGAPW